MLLAKCPPRHFPASLVPSHQLLYFFVAPFPHPAISAAIASLNQCGFLRRLRLIDVMPCETDWLLNYSLNLNDIQCDSFEMTDVTGGELGAVYPPILEDVLLVI